MWLSGVGGKNKDHKRGNKRYLVDVALRCD